VPTKVVIADTAAGQEFEMRDDDGKVLHVGFTPKLSPEAEVRLSLAQKAAAALAANNGYLALGTTATPAQRDAHIRLMVRELNALIRLVLGQLDDDDA
jgi:hypothetical protein